MTYPDIGENSIKVGIDYKNNSFFIEGARRKFSTDPRLELNPQDIEREIARAYLEPHFVSASQLKLTG